MYETSNIWEAAALMSKGHKLHSLKKISVKGVMFVFNSNEDLIQQVDDYMYGNLDVDALTFQHSIRVLKSRAYEHLNYDGKNYHS